MSSSNRTRSMRQNKKLAVIARFQRFDHQWLINDIIKHLDFEILISLIYLVDDALHQASQLIKNKKSILVLKIDALEK